ncbi:hypothetical protein RJ639_039125 [Escallonia herrerae]|uniref:Uncharacterized protein n=1 Tax=Escallonia herrerae TaxID=1293975 RepID=A0AA89BF78_9ASTE|nr:hypothetical protein RJ639_039125 [Escallonia herrerae]
MGFSFDRREFGFVAPVVMSADGGQRWPHLGVDGVAMRPEVMGRIRGATDTLELFHLVLKLVTFCKLHLLHLGNSGRTSNNDYIIDSALVHHSIPQTIFNRFHALPEEINVKLLESGTGNIHLEINTIKQAID